MVSVEKDTDKLLFHEFGFNNYRLYDIVSLVFLPVVLLQASTDQSALDTNIPYQIASFAFILIQLLGIIAVMSQVAWQVSIPGFLGNPRKVEDNNNTREMKTL